MSSNLEEIVATLEAMLEQQKFNRRDFFKPYAKQERFCRLGYMHRERLLMAGNQLGKCISGRTMVPLADGTERRADALYAAGRPFKVMAWTGSGLTEAWAYGFIKKPSEPLVRIWTADGRWFECALDHRVLSCGGNWRFVRDILPDLPCLPASTEEPDQSTRALGAERFGQRVAGWLARCFGGFRRDDAQPRLSVADGRDAETSPADARQHSRPWSRSDGPEPKRTNTPGPWFSQEGIALPANSGGLLRCAARSFAFLARAENRLARPTTNLLRASWQQLSELACLARSVGRGAWGRLRRGASGVPIEGNRLVAYAPIGVEPVYDFTVAMWHNYVAAGVIHHNTEIGAFETACHLTGEYPDWWQGRVFTKPTRGWAAGQTSLVTRDASQKKLCGPPGVDADFGSGYIPRSAFVGKPNLARGVSDAFDTLQVKHVSGGTSTLGFKSYEQGRTKFQADTLDFVWLDEEPPEDIYMECLARITATNGFLFTTFTPLLGRTAIVIRFTDERSEDRAVVTMTMDDIGHLSEDAKRKVIAGYKPHERAARIRGVPMQGEGLVFPIARESIIEAKIPADRVPAHWFKIWGIDFGIGHPFGAVLAFWDRDADVIHIWHTIKIADQLPLYHCKAMKEIAGQVPVAWPHDGLNREKGTGVALKQQYKGHGLRMLPEHATWPDGTISVEASVSEMTERLQSGRLRVAETCTDWLDEFEQYHRKDGLIVASNNDLMDCTHKIMMMKRKAQQVPLGTFESNFRRQGGQAQGVDFNVLE